MFLSKCVCVCSVVVALFVVGWQQHCRYSVIDAMVYPRSWKSETDLVLERLWSLWTELGIPTSGYEDLYLQHCMSWRSSWLELREFYFRFWTEEFRIWSIRHCAWVKRDKFWWWNIIASSISVLEERCILLWLPFWSRMWSGPEIFFVNPLHWIEHPYNVVM